MSEQASTSIYLAEHIEFLQKQVLDLKITVNLQQQKINRLENKSAALYDNQTQFSTMDEHFNDLTDTREFEALELRAKSKISDCLTRQEIQNYCQKFNLCLKIMQNLCQKYPYFISFTLINHEIYVGNII